jgi:hypothetical protein
MKNCHACGTPWDSSPGSQPGKDETCVKCGADMHCCLNCRLFDRSSYQCTSRTTEPIRDKDRQNRCEEFQIGATNLGREEKSVDDMQKKWNDFFK